MACTSEMSSAPLRFTLPSSLQGFDAFTKFPYDIRHLIWESLIFKPGIHFLKFVDTLDTSAPRAHTWVGTSSGSSLGVLVERRNGEARHAKRPIYSAMLTPVFPTSCADNSHYIVLEKVVAQLRNSCREARHVVDKTFAHPENLTLDSGQLVLLHRSYDIVCVDYPGMLHGRYSGKWRERLDPNQLAKVRRLAVRYHHEWDNSRVCNYCGQPHTRQEKHPHPRHVYEFAALFKNLETFYFLDYLTVRKPSYSPDSAKRAKAPGCAGERFSSAQSGRSYFEADPGTCTTYTRVHDTLSWVRKNYIKHCRRKSLGPSDPGKVSFKVLGCEWDSNQQLVHTNHPESQVTPARKRRPRTRNRTTRRVALLTTSALSSGSRSPRLIECNTLPVVFGDHGKSNFEFSPEISF